MSKWTLAGWFVASGAVWFALARPIQEGDERRAAPAPLVKLNVVAVDAHGQSVADLTREDFQVFDAGKPQQIASFRRNDSKPLRVTPALGPGEYSNRSGAPLARATVILLDLLNARFEDRAFAVSELIPALQHVEAADSLFLYFLTMDGDLYPVHALPESGGSARSARPWTDDIKALLDATPRKLYHLRPTELNVDERVRMTYGALEALASRVAQISVRKSIVWISHGVPISIVPSNYWPDTRK